ncbi:MAG: caspase family protein [Bacteroidota bacterium]
MPISNAPKIYALLVGIDAYQEPIRRLSGCIKDIDRVAAYLRSSLTEPAQLQLLTLRNEEATYQRIIQGFREHLTQARPEDVVWFHFSGHGTESYTAPEFKNSIEPNGKDQNLVCYHSAGATAPYLLADKELGILLHEVATAHGSDHSPHMVVSLDCCHSGSGTRFDQWEEDAIQARTITQRHYVTYEQAVNSGKTRGLETYLDGYFKHHPLAVPLTEHILFSACTSIQTAGDTAKGGVFTSGLLKVLESAQGPLNYSDLFLRTRAIVKSINPDQLPQFETIGGFDPYRQFLQGSPLGTPEKYLLSTQEGEWIIHCGAIHGLPVSQDNSIKITLEDDHNEKLVGEITSVGAQRSKVSFPAAANLRPTGFYQARISYLPQPPVLIELSGLESALERLIEVWDDHDGLRWLRAPADTSAAELVVIADESRFRILNRQNDKVVFELGNKPNMETAIFTNLKKIIRWERILALANKKSQLADRVTLEMKVLSDQQRKQHFSDPHLVFRTSETAFIQHKGHQILGFQPQLRISNTSQQLYFYLFHLRSNYSIVCYEGGQVFRTQEHSGAPEVVLPLLKTHKGWGLGPNDTQATSYFKLFVTTEELDYQQLLQSELGVDRDTAWGWQPMDVSDDWWTLMIKVQLEAD